MTIDDLADTLEAHEQRKLKKKQESFDDQVLQTNMTVEEEAMYVQRNEHRRERNKHGRERIMVEVVLVVVEAVEETTIMRVEETTNLVIEEEKVDGIVMLVYEDVVEEEAKVDDIVMMTYEDDVLGITDLKITKPIRQNEERRNNEGPN
ncbi:hypothetical protein Tco_0517012, partial [Tanacetum coccineum]